MTEANDPQKEMVIGFAWYRPSQWQRLRDISSDAHELEDTYEEWLQIAEQQVTEMEPRVARVEKIDVDIECLVLWCNELGVDLDAEARSRYAVEILREMERSQP